MKLIIDRLTWLRGEGEDQSYLYRATDKKMCCLGFYALACGLTIQDIDSQCTPLEVLRTYHKMIADWLLKDTPNKYSFPTRKAASDSCTTLMTLNDFVIEDDSLPAKDEDAYSEVSSEVEREAKLIEEFAKHGVEVEFIN